MSDAFWQSRFRGTPIQISLDDLTLQRLRQAKAWFGESYGIPTEFISLLLKGEVDALALAVWIGQQKAGGAVENPLEMDFSLDDFERIEEAPKPKRGKGGNPTPEEPDTPTTGSQSGASTSSEPGTSST